MKIEPEVALMAAAVERRADVDAFAAALDRILWVTRQEFFGAREAPRQRKENVGAPLPRRGPA